MYFWDSRRLAVDLHNDAVPAATLRNYLIALLIVGAPSVFLGLSDGRRPDVWDGIYIVGLFVIVILGVMRAYQANGGDQGTRFMEKSVALLLPLTIQSFAFGFVMVGVIYFAESAFSSRLSADGKVLMESTSSTLLELGLHAWVLWRLVVHLRDMRDETPNTTAA
jgi:hypothetical protein